MSGAFTSVSKGRFFKAVDARLRRPTQAMLDQLTDGASLFSIAKSTGVARDEDQPHIENQVFGNEWWPNLPNKEQTVRAGYIEAISLSLDHAVNTQGPPLPVESLWFSGSQFFETYVMLSDTKVTMLLATPQHPPVAPPLPANAFLEDIWLVAPPDRCADLKAAYGAEYPSDVEESAAGPASGMKRLRLWGY